MQLSNKSILKIICFLLILEGVAMLPPSVMAFHQAEQKCATSFCLTAIVCLCVGIGMRKTKYISKKYKPKEGFILILFCWCFVIVLGAIPYLMANHGYSLIDSIFESASGWTTTGSSAIEGNLPHSLLLWKTITGWLGGLIVIIFSTAILPYLGIGAQKLAIVEIPGPDLEKLAPRFEDVAKIIAIIYALETLIFFILLIPSRMSIYYALVHTLSTVSTSGIISFNAAQGNFMITKYAQIILTLAALTGGLNYFVFFLIYKKKLKTAIKNYEVRVYLLIFLACGILVSISLIKSGMYQSVTDSLFYSFMQVISFGTTTGFKMTNLTNWPTFTKMLLIVLTLVGGCTFSAGGGIKIIRFVVIYKLIVRGVYKRIHPKAIKPVMFEKKPLAADMASSITSFVLLYFGVFMLGSILIALENLDMETTFSAVTAALSTNGTAFGMLTNHNFSIFSPIAKLGLSILMLAGRLELYPVIILMTRLFWKPNKSNT